MTATGWMIWGFSAQGLFSARFIVQWLASEKAGRSVVPKVFWYLSLGGSLGLLTYAIHRQDYVFMLGQTTGSLIYVRNLVLLAKERNKAVDVWQERLATLFTDPFLAATLKELNIARPKGPSGASFSWPGPVLHEAIRLSEGADEVEPRHLLLACIEKEPVLVESFLGVDDISPLREHVKLCLQA